MAAHDLHRRAACLSQAMLHRDTWSHSLKLVFNSHMVRIESRTSDACFCIYVSLMRGVAIVVWNNGAAYHYRNVSRRAIANLLLNPNMSLGFWANHNCKSERAICSDFTSQAFA